MASYDLSINGASHRAEVEPYTTLLDTLRDSLGMTGSKKGCNEGECGSCTVLLDGLPVTSCLVLIGDAVGKQILTVEGIAADGELDHVQRSFADLGAAQCGYCTPGFVVNTVSLLRENPDPTDDDIRFHLAGNLCRCTGYTKILEAVRDAAEQMRDTEHEQ